MPSRCLAAVLVALSSCPALAGGASPDVAAALALPSVQRSPGAFAAAVGLPNALPIPGYGIAYNRGAYPPPGELVGPYGATFGDDVPEGPEVVVDNGPEQNPSRLSIYAAGSQNGLACSWHHTWSLARGRRWERLCY